MTLYEGERLFVTFTVLSILGYFLSYPLAIFFLVLQTLYDVGFIITLSTSKPTEESNISIVGIIFFSFKIVFNLAIAYLLYNHEYVLLFLYVSQFIFHILI